jgi:hypothetical protein
LKTKDDERLKQVEIQEFELERCISLRQYEDDP